MTWVYRIRPKSKVINNSNKTMGELLAEAGVEEDPSRGSPRRGLYLAVMALTWHNLRYHEKVLATLRRVANDPEEQNAIQVIYHMGGLQGEKAVRRYLWWRIITEGQQHAR